MELSPIAQRIKSLMSARGIENARDLERATDIPYHRSYSWFRRTKAVPSAEDVETLATFFRVPVGHILNGDPISDADELGGMMDDYSGLSPERRRQAEDFVRFLVQQQRAAENREPDEG
ncbi:MAG: helix-turn-helix domain-containing protein [Alishewanella aestuarii]